MADAIKFKRDGRKVHVTVDLDAALAGRTSKGNPGSYGQANVEISDTHDARLSINVYQIKRKAEPVKL